MTYPARTESSWEHIPVLQDEVLKILDPKAGETICDATLGLGGHSSFFLQRVGVTGNLVALDADERNIQIAQKNLVQYSSQITFVHSNFRFLDSVLSQPVDIIFADLGLSSPHLDDPERGFSFRTDAPLDMRLDSSSGETAAKFLAKQDKHSLAGILRMYGEVRPPGKLADEILKNLPQTTFELKQCIENVCGYRAPSVLPQVFQAIRIAVNDEMGALTEFLEQAPALLNPGGRLGIISFHSLEDRMVKQAFRSLCEPIKDDYTGAIAKEAPFALLTKKPVSPSEGEQKQNPRSRSAKFRVLMRVR